MIKAADRPHFCRLCTKLYSRGHPEKGSAHHRMRMHYKRKHPTAGSIRPDPICKSKCVAARAPEEEARGGKLYGPGNIIPVPKKLSVDEVNKLFFGDDDA